MSQETRELIPIQGDVVMAAIGKKNNEESKEPRKILVEHSGDKIILPSNPDMDYAEAREALTRIEEEESVLVSISEKINCFPLDGAVAFMNVLKERYGWTNLTPTPGFWGPEPPHMIAVDVGYEETVQVPWGNCRVPKIDGILTTSYVEEDGMPKFVLVAKVKRKNEKEVHTIARLIRERVKKHSIYLGQAIKINYRDIDGDRKDFNPKFSPKFIDLKEVNRHEAIYSEDIESAIQVNLFNPVQFTDRCRKHGIPLKRGVILGGPYGTGKTLTGYRLADLCVNNNWTFLYLEDVRDLDLAIGFAKLYAPCVLFAEDVDKATAGPRDSAMDKILNSIDGIESKNLDIMVVLTTNHLNSISRAFLRPGRIDSIIEVLPPDADACVRIMRKYGLDRAGNLMLEGSDEELRNAISPMVGANASFIREIVERAKLSAISNSANELVVKASDIAVIAKAMLPHIRLINPEHGIKKLIDLDMESVDPINMATEILTNHFASAFVDQLVDPKKLIKVMAKKMKGTSGSGFSSN
jgi:transitional endoplasmic reticulum ATPase